MYTPSHSSRALSSDVGRDAREGRQEGEKESERGREREKERFADPVGLFDFTCSYVIEYYTRLPLPRWKGWKLLRKGKAPGAEDPNGGREIVQEAWKGPRLME